MQDIKKNTSKVKELEEELKKIRREKRQLSKKLRATIASRENWKLKSKQRIKKLRYTEDLLSKANRSKSIDLQSNPKGYNYSTTIILLVISVRTCCNCSLRGCSKMLEILNELFDLGLSRVPCSSTIYYWECKLGYNRIKTGPLEKSKWTLMIDESISIANQRILLLLGCRVDKYDFDRPLNFNDVCVLWLGVDRSWTELCIGEQIRILQERGYDFVSGVSDSGSSIVKALKVSGLTYVSDCTHYLGNLLKKQYNKTELFKGFSGLCGRLKTELMNSSLYYFVPPKQRVKGRFLNLFELSDWSYYMLRSLQNLDKEVKVSKELTKLNELLKYDELINEIYQQCQTLKRIFEELKSKGLSEQSQKEVLSILENSDTTDYFMNGVKKYLSENVKEKECLVCNTDIIESVFGKIKNRLSANKMNGFGLSCLAIANVNRGFTIHEILKSMENVNMRDLRWWAKNHLPSNVLNARRKWLDEAQEIFG